MQKVIVATSALVLGFAIASVTALAQNIQGPAAPNFGAASSPQIGGISNNAPNANTGSVQQPLYNYTPDNERGRAQPRIRHSSSGYTR